MKRAFYTSIGFLIAGLGLGILEAARWLRLLSSPETLWGHTFNLVQNIVWVPAALLVIGLILASLAIGRLYNRPSNLLLSFNAVFAIIVSLFILWASVSLFGMFHSVSPLYIPVFAVALFFCSALLIFVFTPTWLRDYHLCLFRGLYIALSWTLFILILRVALDNSGCLSFGGFDIFSVLSSPPELRNYPFILADLAAGLLFGLFIGAAISKASGSYRLINSALRGGAFGMWVSGVLYVAHSVIGTLIMQSGYSGRVAFLASIILIPIAGVVVSFGLFSIFPHSSIRKYRLPVLALCVLLFAGAAFYVCDSRRGTDLYIAAVRSHPFRMRTYIHFTADGGWERTFEPQKDSHTIELCDRLLKRNPRCIYAAHALYLKARSQFAMWDFENAAGSLELLRKRYSDFHGSASVLMAHAYLAMGDYDKVVLHPGWNDPVFTHWMSGEGGLVLGHAYEVLGNEQFALGQYTYYLVDLNDSKQGSWANHALRYAEFRSDKVRNPYIKRMHRATIRGRIVSGKEPLANIHLALVQPHIDASSPDSTMQFTGALTVPLWFGLGGTTDTKGYFEIRNVPYGDYEVVVGFDTQSIPADHVISNAIAPLHVGKTNISMPAIRFVPNITLIGPLDKASTGNHPVIKWQSYPGAAYYSVSLISLPFRRSSVTPFSLLPDSYQCWASSGITSTEVEVTSSGFSSDARSEETIRRALTPGGRYSWIVFAYDRLGKIISTSEQYLPDRKPVFFVQPDNKKGG